MSARRFLAPAVASVAVGAVAAMALLGALSLDPRDDPRPVSEVRITNARGDELVCDNPWIEDGRALLICPVEVQG